MRKLVVLAGLGGVLLLALGSYALANGGSNNTGGRLIGYQEVPSVSSVASGEFEAKIKGDRVEYTLSYRDLEGSVTQSHIHFGQRAVNGGISVFFCSNLGNGPVGTPACPPSPATVSGTFMASDVIGPTAQGIAPTEFAELVKAIRAGKTYANVHSSKFPGGEIRAQLNDRRGHGNDDKDDDD